MCRLPASLDVVLPSGTTRRRHHSKADSDKSLLEIVGR
jgi:hypothetical protein